MLLIPSDRVRDSNPRIRLYRIYRFADGRHKPLGQPSKTPSAKRPPMGSPVYSKVSQVYYCQTSIGIPHSLSGWIHSSLPKARKVTLRQ